MYGSYRNPGPEPADGGNGEFGTGAVEGRYTRPPVQERKEVEEHDDEYRGYRKGSGDDQVGH